VDVGPDTPHVINIRFDYQSGIRQAVQHLAALRHSRIAFITGPLELKSALARKEAFIQSMTEIGLTPDLIVEGSHTLEGGMRALNNLIALRPRPSAVLCSNDMTAIGVMREAYDLDVRIPADLSVIGFDDIRLAQFMTPPLTTVQMSQTELARLAFQALLNEMDESEADHAKEYKLVTNLILRRSTGLAEGADSRKPPRSM